MPTFRDLEAMYREAGFQPMTQQPLPPSFQSVMIGYAPSGRDCASLIGFCDRLRVL
jgi:hypothetical protein